MGYLWWKILLIKLKNEWFFWEKFLIFLNFNDLYMKIFSKLVDYYGICIYKDISIYFMECCGNLL